jgi:hypothetical protein
MKQHEEKAVSESELDCWREVGLQQTGGEAWWQAGRRIRMGWW